MFGEIGEDKAKRALRQQTRRTREDFMLQRTESGDEDAMLNA